MGDQSDQWHKFYQETDHFYLSYHRNANDSIWRRISPCLHCWSGKCPLGEQCGFPSEQEVANLYKEERMVLDAMKNYKELQRLIENEKEAIRLIEKRKRKELKGMIRKNQKLLSLPLERFLLQYKITLKRELCQMKHCLEKSTCPRAHSVWDLFKQFDQTFLLEYYSNHFNKSFRAILPKKTKPSQRLELVCLEARCRSRIFHHSALLILHAITGELLEPRVSLTCLCCGNVTHFLVYSS